MSALVAIVAVVVSGLVAAPPAPAAPPPTIARVVAGWEHSCALTTTGAVWCWGANDEGQLGDGTTVDRPVPVPVVGLSGGVARIAAGGKRTCAVLDTIANAAGPNVSDGTVKCWGDNSTGALGDGTTVDRPVPTTVVGLAGVKDVAVGGFHTCAISPQRQDEGAGRNIESSINWNLAGTVSCWGLNDVGQLGNGTTEDSSTPIPALVAEAVGITAGGRHTCAGTVVNAIRIGPGDKMAAKCWGDNAFGQLGNGTGANSAVPVEVSGLSAGPTEFYKAVGVTGLAAGDQHTCARGDQSHVVKCFGRNHLGQLGDGTTTDRLAPVDVVGLAGEPGLVVDAISIVSGRWHSCAPVKGSEVALWCWGSVGPGGPPQLTAQHIPGVSAGSAGSVGAGDGHTCVVVLAGRVQCLGTNSKGQLGNATTVDSATPVLVQFPGGPAPPVTGDDLIITAAGTTVRGYSGDGASATKAEMNRPGAVASDGAGNLYIAMRGNGHSQGVAIRKIDTSGVITTVAGTGTPGYSGDGGPATKAQISGAVDLEADRAGNLYLTDQFSVRRIDAATGIIDTVAGGRTEGDSGDGGPAKAAQFSYLAGLALDTDGRLYLSDNNNKKVRMVTPDSSDGVVDGDEGEIVTTVAGTGKQADDIPYWVDQERPPLGLPATQTYLSNPTALDTDAAGNLYLSEGHRIHRVDTAGMLTTVAGTRQRGYAGDGGPATAAEVDNVDLHVVGSGHLYLAEGTNKVRVITPGADGTVDGDRDDVISRITGTPTYLSGSGGDDGPALPALVSRPMGVVIAPDGALYIAENGYNRIRRVGPDGPLRLRIVDSVDPVPEGGGITYTATVSNFSSGPATAVALRDTLPAETAFVSVDPDQGTCSEAGGTINCALGDIAAGARASVVIKVTAPAKTTTVTNWAKVVSNEPDPYVQGNIDVERTHVGGADLGVSVTDAVDPVAVGGDINYTVTVTNAGPDPATALSLSDTLPPGTTLVAVDDPGTWSCSGANGVVNCSLASLAKGGSAGVRLRVKAPSEVPPMDPTPDHVVPSTSEAPVYPTVANTATVASARLDRVLADNTDIEKTVVVAPVSLAVSTVDSPEPAIAGSRVHYTVSVTNNGALPATGVVLTDTLPADVAYLSNTFTHKPNSFTLACPKTGRVITCDVGTLDPGATAVLSISITPEKTDFLTNTAKVSSFEPELTPGDNTDVEQTVVSTTGSPTGLGLATVDRPDPVAVGQPLTYHFTATNGGPVPATGSDDDPVANAGVVLTDNLPPGVVFESATSENGTCRESGGTVTCELGTIDPGAYVRASITVVPTAPATLTNNARVSASNATEATSVATTLVSNSPCGQVITKDTVLKANIGPCESVGIMVGADNITLDLGGFHIFGTPGPSDRSKNGEILGNQPGIYLPGRTNVTVKNGTVSDFDAGVFLEGGGSNTITGLVVQDNVGPANNNNAVLGDGIALFNSANNTIVSNSLTNNGVYDGIGVLGGGSDGNLIKDNSIEDTYSVKPLEYQEPQEYNHGQGIMVNASSIGNPGGQVIHNTRIVGNIVRGSAAAGLSNINHIDGVIFDNTIEDNGGVNGPANGIGVQLGPGASTSRTNIVIQSNVIRANAADGVRLVGTVAANKVLNNDVTGETLVDDHNECLSNTWSGNTSAASGSPRCTTAADTTAPDTTLVAGPSGPTEDDAPTFEFTSPEPASVFECRVDAAAFSPCSSPHTTAVLSKGAHRFEVRAIDPAGNADPTPPLRLFSVGSATAVLGAVADFDGNGATDISVFRPATGTWFPQGGSAQVWGTAGDIAVPGDYDGDQSSDVAVFRPSSGVWFVQGGPTTAWGTAGDLPVPGDYDGDQKADLAVFRPSSGVWYIHTSGGGADQTVAWGTAGDIPVPGDYNGDGTTETAVFRPSTGTWFVNGGPTTAWGTNGDVPVPGDYDADGATDMAVFRPSSGTWFVNGGVSANWGTTGDIPVPGDYDANGSGDVAVFRPSTGGWYVLGGASTNWGTTGDQPLPLPAAIRQSLTT